MSSRGGVVPTRGQEATSARVESLVNLRAAQTAYARLIGNETLATSFQNHDLGGPYSAELRRIIVLGANAGIGSHVAGRIERQPRLSDADIVMQPKKVKNVYIVSDSTLKLRAKKSKAGYHGPERLTTETLKAQGCSEVYWSVAPGATQKDIATKVKFYTEDQRTRQGDKLGWRIGDVGTIAMNDPTFEESEEFAQKILVESVLVVVWSANDVYEKSGNVRVAPAEGYKRDVENLVESMKYWQNCILIGPGDSRVWNLSPRFDETTEKYIAVFDDHAVPQINPAKLYARIPKRDDLYFDASHEALSIMQ